MRKSKSYADGITVEPQANPQPTQQNEVETIRYLYKQTMRDKNILENQLEQQKKVLESQQAQISQLKTELDDNYNDHIITQIKSNNSSLNTQMQQLYQQRN